MWQGHDYKDPRTAFGYGRTLVAVDRQSGKVLWHYRDDEFLDARALCMKNDRIYCYCPEKFLACMVVASAKDGSLHWTNDVGNLQLVLRDNSIYAAGPEKTSGMQLDYKTGSILASLPARRACTRATGCVDSIFFRATGGTVLVMTDGNQAQHIAPMRPPCQDGVLISNGQIASGCTL